jgi:hypothetical protein
MSRNTYEELVWQLNRLPGGPEAAIPDFFGPLLSAPPICSESMDAWPLHDNAQVLRIDDQLVVQIGDETSVITTLPEVLIRTSQQEGLSPLLLALLAVATGDIEGDRRLKAILPKVDGAAKDLMLMTVCRLCG